MKKFRNLVALLLGVMAVSFTACKTEEPEAFGKPVKDKDFTVTVTGNNVALSCTNATMTSVLWEVSDGTQSTDKNATVYVPVAGEYNVVLSVSNGGDYVSADTVKFTIASSDAAYFSTGIMKALTGGASVKKTWVLDSTKKLFHKPVDFYGDAAAGASADGTSWGPWGGLDIPDPELGEISFDALTGQVTLILDGVTTSGKYSLKKYDRPDDIMNPKLASGLTLWQNMLTDPGKYAYLGSLSAQMADVKLPSGVHFPLQIGRMTNDGNTTYPSQFLTSDLENVTIIHASDSALVVRVKRTYEGDNESKCWMLYNFIVKEYTYVPEVFTYTQNLKTTFTATDLVGTWKFGASPVDWINFYTSGNKGTTKEQTLLNNWATQAEVQSWLASQEQLTAAKANTYVFNANGTCLLNGVANKFTVANGKITFETALTTEFNINWFNITGTTLSVIDVKQGTNAAIGIWIGYQNESKDEFVSVNLVKQ